MNTKRLILALLITACLLTWAQNPPAKPLQNTTVEEENELDVSAERMEILLDGKTIELTDNVRFEDDAMILTASRMMIHLQEDQEENKPHKDGNNQNNMKLKNVEAFGNVVLRKKVDATESVMGDKAVYEVKTDTVTLTGNCVITQAGHVMRGKIVTFDRLKQKINVKQAVITIKLPKRAKGKGLNDLLAPKNK